MDCESLIKELDINLSADYEDDEIGYDDLPIRGDQVIIKDRKTRVRNF